MKKILIVDAMHTSVVDLLSEADFDVRYQPDMPATEIAESLKGINGLVIRSKARVDEKLLVNADALEFVARAGAGVDNVDVDLMKQRSIHLLNSPEGNEDALGEHVVGMLLNLFNRISIADREVRQRLWKREANRGVELGTKTVGVFGYGHMGSAAARKLSGFGCRILAYDKYKKGFGNELVEECSLETFRSEINVLSLHVPLTDETRNLVNTPFLKSFPKLEYVVNTARGEILVLGDLINALREDSITGACLDVLPNEKMDCLSENELNEMQVLSTLDNVVLTPHIGGWTYASYRKISEVLANKIINLYHT